MINKVSHFQKEMNCIYQWKKKKKKKKSCLSFQGAKLKTYFLTFFKIHYLCECLYACWGQSIPFTSLNNEERMNNSNVYERAFKVFGLCKRYYKITHKKE